MEGDVIASGPNVEALFSFLFYAAGMLTLSFILWGVIPSLIIGGALLIGWNVWVLLRPVVVPILAVAWVALNYAIRLGILIGMGWMLYYWLVT